MNSIIKIKKQVLVLATSVLMIEIGIEVED